MVQCFHIDIYLSERVNCLFCEGVFQNRFFSNKGVTNTGFDCMIHTF